MTKINILINLMINFAMIFEINYAIGDNIIQETPCNIKTDCNSVTDDNRVVCVDEKCQCEPNYRWNGSEKVCNKYLCIDDTNCRDYDINRKCDDKGTCVCKTIYTEISFNKKCYPKISGECKSTKECVASGDLNAICINNRCRCRANFKYDENKQSSCFLFTCKVHLDCEEYDKNRICSGDSCVCTDGYIESSKDNLCVPKSLNPSEAPYIPPPTSVPIVNPVTVIVDVPTHTWPQKYWWLIMILSIAGVIFIIMLVLVWNYRSTIFKSGQLGQSVQLSPSGQLGQTGHSVQVFVS